MTRRTAVAVLATLTILGTVSGCGGKEEALQTKSQAQVESMLKSYGDGVAQVIGQPLRNWKTVAAPCEGRNGETATDGRFDMTGGANISLGSDGYPVTLQRLRDHWQQQGYEVDDFRIIPPPHEGGSVSVRNPADGVTMTVQSTATGTSLALLVATPCYRPAPGEHPAD
jgi:hypothetical protein